MSDDVAYVMEIDVEGSPKGEPFQIVGLGTFENGKTYEVTKDEAAAYRSYHTRQVPVFDEETNAIIDTETELGPTLLQASKTMFGIMVATPDSGSGSSSANPPSADPDPVTDPAENDDTPEGGGE